MGTNWTLDTRLETGANTEVLAFLRRKRLYAHSDVAEELIRSGERLPGVHHYCPDSRAYAFVALVCGDHTIIGLAYGQSSLNYRLPVHRVKEAIEASASIRDDLGTAWVCFPPWTSGESLKESRGRLASWCRVAYESAAGSGFP